jgi:GH43 family beta-xylosidase
MRNFVNTWVCFLLLVNALAAQTTFTNPIKTSAADPQITYIDGYYYFLFTTGDGVWLRRHQNMHEVGNDAVNGKKKVWGWNSEIVGHVWAPEIFKINGKFYIYASGSVTGNSNPESMRMFVLEANTADPFGAYTYKGLLSNKYAIDQSVWQDPSNNELYMSYSQWDNNIPNANPASLIQCTYICKMISPTQMGTGVRLSYPATTWEKHKWWVNEGQYFLKKGNKLHIVFSVSGCAAAEYSLAILTCSNGDYLNPSAWTKSTAPVFTQDPSINVYGTGHHATLQTPNGEWWLVYHAVSDAAGACDGTRSTRMQPFTFDANDNPVFGKPIATGVPLPVPGASAPPNYWNFTSDLEGWNTPTNLTATASNGNAVLTVTNADPYLHSPNNLNVSASNHKYVVISMRNQTASNTAELFWTTNSSPAFDGAKRVSFSITPNDTKQRYYIIDLSANSNWTGTIKQLRIDPTLASSGSVSIDFVKFSGAYPSTISSIPGTIEAENFNKGGQGNAYKDNDLANQGGQYRTSEAVDISTASDGGYNVGWIDTGEWTEYLVRVNSSRNYTLSLKAASVTTANKIRFEIDGEALGTAVTINNTGGLQTYNTFNQTVTLSGGLHIIRLFAEVSNGGLNISSFAITEIAPIEITPFTQVNGGTWDQKNTAEVCAGGSVSFGPHPNVETGWAWTGPNGFTASTRQISFAAIAANKAGNYVATYTDGNGNTGTQTFTITVNALPAATISNTTPLTFCAGGSVVLTSSAGASYKWFRGTTQVGTASTYTASAAGSYTVEVTNAAGCKATSTAKVVTVNALPTATISNTTPLTFCAGGSVVLTSSAGTSYKWFNGTTQVGTAATYTASAAGSYTVEVTNATGCKATSTAKVVTVNALPTATISNTTPLTFCEGGSVVLTASTGTTYKWFNGKTTLTTATATHSANAIGSYTVEVSNANGCKATSAAIIVTVNPLPSATVTITSEINFMINGGIVFTFPDNPTRTAIAFSRDNAASFTSVADNSGTFKFDNLSAGNYDLWMRWGNAECPVNIGRKEIKNDITTSLSSIDETNTLIKIYPNPANDFLNIIVPDLEIGQTVILYNSNGTEVYNKKIEKNYFTISLSNLSAGAYGLKVNQKIYKVVLIK